MKRALVVGVLLATTVAGCGGADQSAATLTTRPTPPPSAHASAHASTHSSSTSKAAAAEVALTKALLTVRDLPTGWAVTPPTPSPTTAPATSTDPTCQALFTSLDRNTDHPARIAKAGISFAVSDLGPFLEEDISSFANSQQPKRDIERLAAALSQCPTFTDKQNDGTTTTYTATAISFPKVGDQTFAARIGATGTGLALNLDLVLVRVGHCGIDFLGAGIGAVDATLLLDSARIAVHRAKTPC